MALMALAHSTHVSNIYLRWKVMGSFISSAANAEGCPFTASATSLQKRMKSA
eukprot:CAMPEP_0172914548 /NCGR_PEP_ID=MMETSP1075-20121228/192634_1 /TAXON_ID=2916 /ORGANISM="Ceratium fusus, Strain PA161109" /LENGTH=51 /DNA_ID=CAMNT_0013773485 /DNA_START=149 /DNA_END=300 /DNA_ORIENTATION=+